MRVKAYRICKTKYDATSFSGEGARLYGGRWNSAGVAVVYIAETVALATLDLLVHTDPAIFLGGYCIREVTFDEKLVTSVEITALPKDWHASPPIPATRDVGDKWAQDQTSAVLRVPSAVTRTEFNYLLNPNHADWTKVHVGPMQDFCLDARLVR